MTWVMTAKAEYHSGAKRVRYEAWESPCKLEARRRVIPDGNGGSRTRMTYFVIAPDGTETEYLRMQDAKKAAEEIKQ